MFRANKVPLPAAHHTRYDSRLWARCAPRFAPARASSRPLPAAVASYRIFSTPYCHDCATSVAEGGCYESAALLRGADAVGRADTWGLLVGTADRRHFGVGQVPGSFTERRHGQIPGTG